MAKQTKYPFIWAWGKMLGSHDYFIEAQEERAIRDKAPQDAVFLQMHGEDHGKWTTLRDVKSAEAIEACVRHVQEMRAQERVHADFPWDLLPIKPEAPEVKEQQKEVKKES